ncbi:ArnT family glycosyltransferase [Variovorax sp. RT4R15]|uniref:ArnT family glycosyltransferase n=1 Tax=Variovorax sp. RT4R15 TaxID=3443737 RepID=UPI003F47C391
MKSLRTRAVDMQSVWLVAGVFAWLAATAWFRPLMAPDEGRYVGVAAAMLRSGDWVVPRLDGLPFFHKPPLFYWISAGTMALLGGSEWAARMPSLIGAALAAAALFMFLRRWSTLAQAGLSVAVLVTTPFFYLGAQFANLDMLVAGCISATLLSAASAALARESQMAWRAPLAGAFLFAALGVLAKGLIGLVLPGMIYVAWCATTHHRRALRLMAWPPGWAILLAVAGPWFVVMQSRYPGFFDYFVVTQHFRRFAASGSFNNQHAFWFYLPVIAGLTLPWFGWLLAARWRGQEGRPALSDVDWLMLLWCAGIVVFFSLPRSKLIGYVLPALPPLAYLIARGASAATAITRRRWTTVGSALLCVACVVVTAKVASPPGARLKLPQGQVVGADDQVLMLDAYYYEIPFYWGLNKPVMVSGDWTPALVEAHDNWRKELYDAAQFEPGHGAERLVDTAALPGVLCRPRATWLIGPSNAQLANPWLVRAQLVTFNDQAAVWRFAGSAQGDPHCLSLPTARITAAPTGESS